MILDELRERVRKLLRRLAGTIPPPTESLTHAQAERLAEQLVARILSTLKNK